MDDNDSNITKIETNTMALDKTLLKKQLKKTRGTSFQAPSEHLEALVRAGVNISEVCRRAIEQIYNELKKGGLK